MRADGLGARDVLVVTGLRREARLARGAGIEVLVSGGSRAALEARLSGLKTDRIRAVVSFGLAGALDPSLAVGDVVLADRLLGAPGSSTASQPANSVWERLLASEGEAYRCVTFAGVDAPLLDAGTKRDFRQATGADAVDMESHVAAAFAAERGLPFGIIRVISDAAGDSLPPLAGSAMRPDGSVDILGVLAGLARDPSQLPPLIATARNAGLAFRRLGRVRRLLGRGLGLDL